MEQQHVTLKSNESIADNRAPSAQGPASSTRHSYRNFALRAIVGIAIVAFLVWRYDARSILRLLARERPAYFAAAMGVYLSTLVLCAYRWRLLAAVLRLDAPFTDFLSFRFIATFANTLIPGVAGGDALRAIYLGRRTSHLGEAVASVLADRIVGLIGLIWLAAGAAIIMKERGLPSGLTTPPTIAGLVALAAFVATPLIVRLVQAMPSRFSRYSGFIVTYLQHRGALVTPLALSVLVQSVLAVCQYLLALGIGINAPFTLFLFCVPIAGVFASLPLTVNGLGVRESAYLLLFGIAGVDRTNAIALGLLWFACTALGALPGALALAANPTAMSYSRD